MQTLLDLEKQHVLHTYNRNMVIARGEGPYVWDDQDNQFLDFTSGISVCNLGHCHPDVTRAITEQAAKLVHSSNYFINEHAPVVAKFLADHAIGGKCFFGNSGAEANEGLIKFARKWGSLKGKRSHIVCMDNSFHGRTLGTLAATGRAKYREGFGPDLQGFSFATFNDLESVKNAITDETVAIMLEPVQGEGGVIPATRDFITGIRQLCDQHNLLFLADEIQCGMARTGTWFAFQRFGVKPDALSIAKAVANGVPMGIFQIRQDYADVFAPGMHGTTFGGNPLAAAAARATLNAMCKENIIDNVRIQGDYLFKKLAELKGQFSCITDVRGLGLMLGVEIENAETLGKITAACKANGLLVLTAGERVLRLMPPLTITRELIDQALERIVAAFKSI